MSSPSCFEDDFASAFERFTDSRPASSVNDTTSPDDLDKAPILRRIANRTFEREPASSTRFIETSSLDESHYELAAEELIASDDDVNSQNLNVNTSTMSANATLYPSPAVDYKAEARALVNKVLRDPRLEQPDIQVLLEHFPMILSRGCSHLEAAYLYHKLSDMAEDIGIVLASTTHGNKTSRPALLRSLANHLLGMMNLFAMGMEPVTTKPVDLATLCTCNACGHSCQIPNCSAQHVCVAVGLVAKDSMALGLGAGVRDMPAPTICPGACRLPHGLRAADVVCAFFLENAATHDPKCPLGHDQAPLRRAILEEHRRLCPTARKEVPVKEDREESEETSSSSGRRNPVGTGLMEDGPTQEDARLELAEGSRKRSRWNLRAFRK